MEPWLRVLKVFVVVTGIILIGGTIAFVYLFLNKRETERAIEIERQAGPAVPVVAPAGAAIRDVQLQDGRALVVLEGADGRDYLMYVDLDRGERISLVVLEPQP